MDDKRIKDSAGNEALVTAAANALKVDIIDPAGVTIEDLETALNNLEEALHSINTDYLKVQARDAAGNLMPSMDAAARKGFVALTDGTDTADIVKNADAAAGAKGIIIFGRRFAGTDKCEEIPVAASIDANADKAQRIVPVTPMTGQAEEGTRTHSNDACFSINFGVDGIDAKTGYVLIDLSDATNYPHTETTEIHVDWVSITIHGDATSTGDIHVGFISAIDATKGTMHTIATLQISKLESITSIHKLFAPSAIRCKLAAHLSGGTALHTDDTTFQNDTTLTGTFGTPTPAIGDLVLLIDRTAGTFEHVHIAVGYHTI